MHCLNVRAFSTHEVFVKLVGRRHRYRPRIAAGAINKISSKAGRAQGAELGKQTAATNLGVAVGSAAGGLLFDFAPLPDTAFLLMTVLTVL